MTFVKFHPNQTRRPNFNTIFNEIMNHSFPTVATNQGLKTRPATNVVETNESFELALAIPGLSKEAINIDIEKEVLTISAKKENTEEKEDKKYMRQEFNYADFKRVFQLPETVDTLAIDAKYQNGILTLVLPKKEEAKDKGPQTINVK